jgi:hypothetical protein
MFENKIKGYYFILTGSMWAPRSVIEKAILDLGGFVENRLYTWGQRKQYFVQATGEWGKQTQKMKVAQHVIDAGKATLIDDQQLYNMILESHRAVETEFVRLQGELDAMILNGSVTIYGQA